MEEQSCFHVLAYGRKEFWKNPVKTYLLYVGHHNQLLKNLKNPPLKNVFDFQKVGLYTNRGL